jgi:Arc/MetJ-type ribon-helix-helix transcriptional regulator
MNTEIQTHIPEQLNKQMQLLITEGWFSNMDEIFSDSLRRFLDSHKPEIMEHFIQEDIDWGLNGTE